MNIIIRLNDGREATFNHPTYSAVELETKMNDHQINAIAIGDSVFAKYAISYVAPTGTITTPVQPTSEVAAE